MPAKQLEANGSQEPGAPAQSTRGEGDEAWHFRKLESHCTWSS